MQTYIINLEIKNFFDHSAIRIQGNPNINYLPPFIGTIGKNVVYFTH